LKNYVVIRVDKDPRDTYSVELTSDLVFAIHEAMDLACVDNDSIVEYTTVTAIDAGYARLVAKDFKPMARL
jgi:hypothetical protein